MQQVDLNYVVYHLHSDLSNGVTNIDSVTKFKEYIARAKELGMKALGFSEHGSVFEWYHKKEAIEEAGMKYIHAIEAYVTETLDEKIRDNYHCVLIALNDEGRKEINRLSSRSFNRKDNHYYYAPRILMDDIENTSDNILITTACLGGVLNKGNDEFQKRFLKFLITNKHRCYLEIQHHNVEDQKKYNKAMYELSKKYGIPLIAGTDTHALNETHMEGRKILQLSKGVHFADEDAWDLTFKSFQELCDAYWLQDALPKEVWFEAIMETNRMAERVQEFTLDRNTKYPKIYQNPLETYKNKINQAYKVHPYIRKRYKSSEINPVIKEEVAVYEKTKSIDFMLLQTYLREWEKEHDIFCGYGRGSVSGSEVAYVLGITQMDSKKFGLNFFRLHKAEVKRCELLGSCKAA